MTKEKICLRCHRRITEKEKYVLLGTYLSEKAIEETFFHSSCWEEYFKDCVTKKINSMMGTVMQTFQSVTAQ